MSADDLRTDLQVSLVEIRSDLVQMATLVTEGVGAVTQALVNNDTTAADVVIAADDALDLLNLEAEEKCFQILALQQPVAIDLRTVLTDLHMIGELERSGDLVTNIAKAIGRIAGVSLSQEIIDLIKKMGEQAARLTSIAITSYVNRDSATAETVGDIDDVLDELQREYLEQVFSNCKDGAITIQQAVQLAVVGRFYERIGDHAVNVAERVLFLVTGSLPEHSGAERARALREQQQQGQHPEQR